LRTLLSLRDVMTELKLQQCRLDGRYDIQDCLGRGSYAEIYVAHDIAASDGSPRTIVIKALNLLLQEVPDLDLERTLIENFQNEAVALDRVRHPNIISRLGHGTAIDLAGVTFHYLVLEYLPGGDLAKMCRQQPLSLERSLFYLKQVCAGLAHAHESGVIHRDIKPQNLLLTADRQKVKIADFGVAKIEATEGIITRVGTNIYAAPEHNPVVTTGPLDTSQLTALPLLTPAADIYSLAKTTYTLLAGESPRRFSHRQITEFPAPIAKEMWADSVIRVLRRATENNPAKRYQSVKEFWEELNDATLPPTQPLRPQTNAPEASSRANTTLTIPKEAVPEAPPRPRFNSTRELKQTLLHDIDQTRPRIVVRVAEDNPAAKVAKRDNNRKQASQIIESFSDAPESDDLKRIRQTASAGRWSRLLVAMMLILAFAGMLFATHYYFRGRFTWGARSAQSTAEQTAVVGREGLIENPNLPYVNLRPDPSMNNSQIKTVVNGTRVRVLNVSDSWYEVEVIQYGPGQSDPNPTNRGWISKRFINLV
jgi:serine/threonine protein kinase